MYETLVPLVAFAWVTIGLALSLFMGRRGHVAFGWFVLGALMGPMALIFAAEARRHPEDRPSRVVSVPLAVPGEVDVLAGIDGSPESLAAFETAAALFGPRIGRVTLATVLPFEAGREDERQAAKALEAAAERSDRSGLGLEILHGRPGEALVELAARDGYDLLVIGKRGTGLAKRVLGSTAAELARDAKVPLLLPGD